MRVLVLGGTGVISREIVKLLLRENHDVLVFNRGQQSFAFLKDVEQIIGDRSNVDEFSARMKGLSCDVVIDMISFTQPDAHATVSAFEGRVKHIIFCSSVAAYKRPMKSSPIVEAMEELVDNPTFLYGFEKAEMERYLQRRVIVDKLPITVIRPSLTYGEGGKNVGVLRQNQNIVHRIREGKPLVMFGDGTNPWNFTFAADLAKAFVGAMANEKTYGQAYHATNETIYLWNDLYLEFGKVLGIEPHIVHLSTDLLYQGLPDTFGHIMFEKMYPGLFSSAKIRRDVPSFQPTISLRDGLAMMVNWYEEAKLEVDAEKDRLEDALVDVYNDTITQMRSIANR